MRSLLNISLLAASFITCLNSNPVHAGDTAVSVNSINEDFVRSLQRQRQCGKPINECRKNRGRCMAKEDCLGQDAPEGFVFDWKPSKGLCKVRRNFKDECGCCIKSKLPTEEEIKTEVETRMEAVGMAVSNDSDDARLSFSLIDGEGMRNVGLMLGDSGDNKPWSFKQHGGSVAKVDCSQSTCTVRVQGEMHSQLVDDIFPPSKEESHESKGRLLRSLGETEHDGDFISQVIPATLEISFRASLMGDKSTFANLLDWGKEDPKDHQIEIVDSYEATLVAKPTLEQIKHGLDIQDVNLDGQIGVIWRPVVINFDPNLIKLIPRWLLLERKRNLCVQPVRTKHRKCLFSMFGICWVRSPTYEYSGNGLAFGQPGANTQWGKVDITFTWRNWITIDDVSGKYQSVTEAEMGDLHAEVSTNDCVEVFFVKEFDPNSLYGGGASWSSGTANNKVVSSDGNDNGIDFTHLAHELGHSLGLMHPGSAGGGSTGTLLCPSGWMNDNPAVNSVENGNLASNPLLTNYWGYWNFDSPDCTDSSDCGSC
mmetsp:Transcript_73218/g.161640  ORF Transcript_73218/g.161640 Transcript_73218/m.161640 type:complete len:538 (-) Transcript_73218:54-1667(-)